jgi:CelD/BcsL family acetyltransferase involved in cellulose biosynthesis
VGTLIEILEPEVQSTADAAVYEIDPTTDARWDSFLDRHPQASVFHSREWLEALKQTYGYTPVAFTTSPASAPLSNAIPFCKISGVFGKQRLVSLPFSDHCQPLVESVGQLKWLALSLQRRRDIEGWDHVELRPRSLAVSQGIDFFKSQSFYLHRLDLRPTSDAIFRNLHKNCVQRKIRRAEKECLAYKTGVSERSLGQFYKLLLTTRRRHGMPVQPIEWFRNLIQCFGSKLNIRVASKDGQPIASILTIRHKQTLVYKYGCSDRAFSRFGGTQLLLWRAILESKADRLLEFDLGRSDSDNSGLLAFKDRWGATRTELTYLRYPASRSQNLANSGHRLLSKYVWSHAPDGVLAVAGRALYKHMG